MHAISPPATPQASADFASQLFAFGERFRGQALPDEAAARALDAITDAIGCMVLGARETMEGRLRAGLFGQAATAAALKTLLAPADGAPTDAQGAAALYLGTLAHAVDFDDISHPAYCHPTALLLPPLLVRASAIGASGADLIRAYIVGVETLGQLGRRLNTAHYERGWHATGTFGTLGATAALCWLEQFSEGASRTAMGIAASLAGGVRQNFGTMTKPLHAGLPGRSAILATRLAAQDFTSADDAIDGRHGFLSTFGGSASCEAKEWGAPLEIMTDTGLALKAYPCCAATHPAIDAARAVRRLVAGYRAENVGRVRVGASRFAMQPLIHDIPHAPLEGKFSMRYCVATALLDETVNMESFLQERLGRDEAALMIARIQVEVDERVAEDHEFAAIVDLTMQDGEHHSVRIDVPSGKPGNWLSASALRGKFTDCVGREHAQTLYEKARALPTAPSARELQKQLIQAIGGAVAAADGPER